MSGDVPQESGGRFWTGPAAGPHQRVPGLTVFTGPAGSGKSRVAAEFARRHGAVYLDKDSLAGPLAGELLTLGGADPHSRDESEFYVRRVMDLEYAGMLEVAGDNLRIERRVVLDAPFGKYLDDPGYLEHVAVAHRWPADLDVAVVQVRVPAELRQDRLRSRALDRDRWKLENWVGHGRGAVAECRWRGAAVIDFDNSSPTLDLEALDRALFAESGADGAARSTSGS